MNMRKMKNQVYAVSPVIATLMLVLVSVGSAGVFYVFQNDWQSGAQDQVSDASIKETLRIAGSTTVYPLTQASEPFFEAEYPLIDLVYQGGGSGAGRTAVGTGLADIGAASSESIASGKMDNYPDYDGDGKKDAGTPDIKQFLVASGSVVVIVNKDNPWWAAELSVDGLNQTQLREIYMTTGDNDSYTHIYDRSTVSGTEETFVLGLLGYGKSDAASPYQIEDLYTASVVDITGKKGNPEVVEAVAAEKKAIGFVEAGFAYGNDKVVAVPFNVSATEIYGDETGCDAGYDDEDYPGNRNCYYLTVGEPTGVVKLWIDWITFPDNNIDMCELAGLYTMY
jgi:phosphate transport system substrate-binding protein